MSGNGEILVRPKLNVEKINDIILELFGLKVISITELNGYDDKNYRVTVDVEVKENSYIEKVAEDGYVLKVINTLESREEALFEAQSELMIYLNSNGICCPIVVRTKQNKYFEFINLSSGKHLVRLLEFIPGEILHKIPEPRDEVYYQVGVITARIDSILENFHNKSLTRNLQWSLESAPKILEFIDAVDPKRHKLVKDTISRFCSRVLPFQGRFQKGIIHGDINEQNLIIDITNSSSPTVKAVIDFGDTHYCCYLFELAVAMTYMIFTSTDIEVGGLVLAGYSSVRPVSNEDVLLLRICIMTRFCQSLVLGAYASLEDPGNEYILTTAKEGWDILQKLSEESDEGLANRWLKMSKIDYASSS